MRLILLKRLATAGVTLLWPFPLWMRMRDPAFSPPSRGSDCLHS